MGWCVLSLPESASGGCCQYSIGLYPVASVTRILGSLSTPVSYSWCLGTEVGRPDLAQIWSSNLAPPTTASVTWLITKIPADLRLGAGPARKARSHRRAWNWAALGLVSDNCRDQVSAWFPKQQGLLSQALDHCRVS